MPDYASLILVEEASNEVNWTRTLGREARFVVPFTDVVFQEDICPNDLTKKELGKELLIAANSSMIVAIYVTHAGNNIAYPNIEPSSKVVNCKLVSVKLGTKN